MKLLIRLNLLLMLVSLAAGQVAGGNAVEVRKVDVVPSGEELKVEIDLTAPVVPAVLVATHPDRLVLDLPNTTASARQQRAAVNQNGVKAVRIGLNSANPPITRLVIDLDQPRLYQVSTAGNKVTLTVLPAENAKQRKGAPVPAASGAILGRLHRQPTETLPAAQAATAPAPVTPPPALPPLHFPEGSSNSSTAAAKQSASQPSAAHPNYGSLQQGTAYPNMGTPGTGVVPAANGPSVTVGATNAPTAFPDVAVVHGDSVTPLPPSKPTQGATPGTSTAPTASTAAAASTNQAAATSQTQSAPVTATVTKPSVGAPAPTTPSTAAQNVASAPPPPAPTGTASIGTANINTASEAPAKPLAPAPQSSQVVAAATVAAVATPAPATNTAPSAPTKAVDSAVPSPSVKAEAVTTPAPAAPTTPASQPAAAQSAAGTSTSIASAPTQSPTTSVQPSQTPNSAPTVSSSAAASSVTPTTPPATTPSTVASSLPAPAVPNPSPAAPVTPVGAASAPSLSPAPAPAKTAAAKAPDLDIQTPVLLTRPPNSDIRVAFKVKYVAEGVAYLDGGRTAGLSEGMKLVVLDKDPFVAQPTAAAVPPESIIAELEVNAVADSSAVADVHSPKRALKAGDVAYLSSEETEAMIAQRSLSATRKYPAVVTFTDNETLDEEARAEVPRPPLPEINRARGRFGFDYSGIMSHGATSMLSSSFGMMVNTDMSRIGGSYWNMSGFWRGRFTSTSASGVQQPTLQDLINRTYHLGLTYDNPNSPFVAGFGRLYLPWATSLETIDGGYFGVRPTHGMIVGLFAGSTPDPSSYSYNPDLRIAGTFLNFSGGSWDDFRYSSTSGVGLDMLKWQTENPFVFVENEISYKRIFSIYEAAQADRPSGNPAVPSPGPGLGRSFFTFRVQPVSRIEFDFNHTYFRDIPTFDPTLIGTGLLDKYLFQGFSAGTRIEVLKQVWVYTTLGKSSRTGDAKNSMNELYGLTLGHLPWTGIRADAHYSRFNSSFGTGSYEALSLSRSFHDAFHGELLAGEQSFVSSLAANNKSHFVTTNLDTNLGRHYFFMGGYTWNRGGLENYDQWYFSLGYRFDSKYKAK